ncbi:MAG: redoxin domain-containing protein [Sedimentisphaerales bacterium]|nr:redoxin domain-containing protein [Sedimentisphaerales bacterium]
MRKKVLLVLFILVLSILIYPSFANSSGQKIDPNESRAWYILNQVDTQSLMVGLPQRLGKAVMSTERQSTIWQGVDNGGSIELEIKVEGKKTGQIFVGFFTDPRWWLEPSKQIRAFPGPGSYKVDRLIPGKYYIGAMIGSIPVPDALGVDNFWPESVQIEQGKSIKVKLLLSDKFQNAPFGDETEVAKGNAGQYEVTNPSQLITLQTLDENGDPAPFCRVVFVDRVPSNPSQVNFFHDNGTDEKGYAYYDKFSGPFTFNVQRFDFIPENFAQRYQFMRLEELHYTKDHETISFKWPPFPTGTGKVKGRIHNQYGKPLTEYYLTVTHDIKGSAQSSEDNYGIGYKIPVTNPEGRFEINDLPSGKYTAMVRVFDYPTHVYSFNMGEFTITDEPDSITEFVLEVEAKELFYGRAFYKDGSPVYPAFYELLFPTTEQIWPTEKDGSFRVAITKKELQDLMETTEGRINIYARINNKRVKAGEVNIKQLSKDSTNVTKFEFEKIDLPSETKTTETETIPQNKSSFTPAINLSYAPSLKGKVLPDLEKFKTTLYPTDRKDRILIICFFNIEQRPSRNFIIELNKKAQDLKAKGIEIIAVHSSEIEQTELDDWLKENNILFPVSTIKDNAEQTRFNWGVKALPWLILTDRKHIIQAEGFSIDELDVKINDSDESSSNVFEPDTVLERMKTADAAMAKGFTVTGIGGFCRQWTVTMGEGSCIIVRKLRSSSPTAEDIIEHNKIPVLGGRSQPVDVNSRPLRAFIVEQSITYFDPNCSANKDFVNTYKLTSEEKVEMSLEHAVIDFEKPEALTYSFSYRMFVWSLGRGFSKNIEDITSAILLPNGNLKCQATVRDYESKSKRWELVVDPKQDFLVKSATYFRDSEPYYKIDVNETSQVGDMFIAKKTNWQGPLGAKAQLTYESVELRPDLELIKSVQRELFGPYTTSADVRDDTGSETVYKFKEIGETYRLAFISLSDRELPNIYGLCPVLKSEQLKEKYILVCFFDIEQRPSRNCILELNKKAPELKTLDIEIIAVHSSKIEQAKLDEWLKENNISFRKGMIQENEEQTRFNWGVKALPWLILTDKEHIVQAEGFSLNELDDKIETITEK